MPERATRPKETFSRHNVLVASAPARIFGRAVWQATVVFHKWRESTDAREAKKGLYRREGV
jgi:hypothetical protein